MMTIVTKPENQGFELGGDNSAPEHIPFENPERVLIGHLNASTGEIKMVSPPVSVSPVSPDSASNTAVPCVQNADPAHVPISEKSAPGRSYTKRIEIGGKLIFVTLHPDRIELKAKYGRQRAEWSFEKLWDAAEGRLC